MTQNQFNFQSDTKSDLNSNFVLEEGVKSCVEIIEIGINQCESFSLLDKMFMESDY